MATHLFKFGTLKECFEFLKLLNSDYRMVEYVAGELETLLKDYYEQHDNKTITSALQEFLGNVNRFHTRLVNPYVYGLALRRADSKYSEAEAHDIVKALLECIPKFLAAIYFLWYRVNAAFSALGGGQWANNRIGWGGYFYGDDIEKYLHAPASEKVYGVLPGGFTQGEVRHDNSGYFEGFTMADDLQSIFSKNYNQFFRDLFSTSVLTANAGANTHNTANALALVGVFCEIVLDEKQNDSKELIEKLNEDLSRVLKSPGKSINWQYLKQHCVTLQSQFGNIFSHGTFSHTGYNRKRQNIKEAEFATKTAEWMRNNLDQVKNNLINVSTGYDYSDRNKIRLAEHFTKNLFPYGFIFGFEPNQAWNKNASNLLQTWRDAIDKIKVKADGLEKLGNILNGAQPPPPPPEPAGLQATKIEATNSFVMSAPEAQIQGKKVEGTSNQKNGQSDEASTVPSSVNAALPTADGAKGDAGPAGAKGDGGQEGATSIVVPASSQNSHVQASLAGTTVANPPKIQPGPISSTSPTIAPGPTGPPGMPGGSGQLSSGDATGTEPTASLKAAPMPPPSVSTPAPSSSGVPGLGGVRGPGGQGPNPGFGEQDGQMDQTSTDDSNTGSPSAGSRSDSSGGNVRGSDSGKDAVAVKPGCPAGKKYRSLWPNASEICASDFFPTDQTKMDMILNAQRQSMLEDDYKKLQKIHSQRRSHFNTHTTQNHSSNTTAGSLPQPTGGRSDHARQPYEPQEGRPNHRGRGAMTLNKETKPDQSYPSGFTGDDYKRPFLVGRPAPSLMLQSFKDGQKINEANDQLERIEKRSANLKLFWGGDVFITPPEPTLPNPYYPTDPTDMFIDVPKRTVPVSTFDLDLREDSPPCRIDMPFDAGSPFTPAKTVNFELSEIAAASQHTEAVPDNIKRPSVQMCIPSWTTHTPTDDLDYIPEIELFPAEAPRTIRDMLRWLAGIRSQKHLTILEKCINKALGKVPDGVPGNPTLCVNNTKLKSEDVIKALKLASIFSSSVLSAIEPDWKQKSSRSGTVKGTDTDHDQDPDGCALLCQLQDYVYACYHQLAFLRSQCAVDKFRGGWMGCQFGRDVTADSPLQAFLTDAYYSRFNTHLFDPCDVCLKSRIRMGFRKGDFSKSAKDGSYLYYLLSPSCSGDDDPLMTLSSYLNCLGRRTPRTTGELVSFFQHFGSEMRKDVIGILSDMGTALSTPHPNCPEWDHLRRHDLDAVRGIRVSESPISKHDNDHTGTLSTLVGCDTTNVQCTKLLSPITHRAYAIYSPCFVHTYLSWAVYLADTLRESLDRLRYDFTRHEFSKCGSIHHCHDALPYLYFHGFTPPEGTSTSPVTCSQVIAKLEEVVNGEPIAKLITCMDKFLYRVRWPFIYTLMALWSTAFLLFAHTALYRLDVLRIQSHFMRSRGSHVIDVKALLTDGTKMPSLYDIDYFDDEALAHAWNRIY